MSCSVRSVFVEFGGIEDVQGGGIVIGGIICIGVTCVEVASSNGLTSAYASK